MGFTDSKTMKLLLLATCLTLTLGGHSRGYSGGYSGRQSGGDIPTVLTSAGATTLVDLVTLAGLGDTLAGEGPFTVFAPTNDAFAKLPASLVNTLKGDTELLKQVLLNHVVAGHVKSGDITNDIVMKAVGGQDLRANIYLKSNYYDGFVTVNGARVTHPDLIADNGVIHFVSDVLYPFTPEKTIAEVASSDPRFSTLVDVLTKADLAAVLSTPGPFTVFAPTNDAFAKVPAATLDSLLSDNGALTKVLLRHVVPGTVFSKGIKSGTYDTAGGDKISAQVYRGGKVKVSSSSGSASVIEADILASNGVIHVIDSVI